jgi:predicted nucleotidyltransferase
LRRLRVDLDDIFGERLERVVLYGSRERGDADADSDYDVAVFLHEFADRWQEIDRLIPIVTAILYEDEAFIHAMPFRAGAYRERTPLMREIRREGIDLGHRAELPASAQEREPRRRCNDL